MARQRIKLKRGEVFELEIVNDDGSAVLFEGARIVTMDTKGDAPDVRIQASEPVTELYPDPEFKSEFAGTGFGAAARAKQAEDRAKQEAADAAYRKATQAQEDFGRTFVGMDWSTEYQGPLPDHDDNADAAAWVAAEAARAKREKERRNADARAEERERERKKAEEAKYERKRQADQATAAERERFRERAKAAVNGNGDDDFMRDFFRSIGFPPDGGRIPLDDIFGRAYKSGPEKRSPFNAPPPPPKPPPEYEVRRPLPKTWRTTLGFPEGTTPTADAARSAYRELMKTTHPDHGGKHEDAVALNVAWSEARRSLGIR